MSIVKHGRAGLGGLALLLAGCGGDPAAPEAPTPSESQAIAEAEEMIAAGRPGGEESSNTQKQD